MNRKEFNSYKEREKNPQMAQITQKKRKICVNQQNLRIKNR